MLESVGKRLRWYLRRLAPEYVLDYLESRNLEELEAILTVLVPFADLSKDAVDVGANQGTFTLFFKSRYRSVLAFEPLGDLANILRLRHKKRVQVFNVALSSAGGKQTLFIPVVGQESVHSRSSLNRDANVGFSLCPTEVEVCTLDQYGFDNIGVIKIDVEGHEMEVLEGAAATIGRCKPLLVVEIEERHHPGKSWSIIDYIVGLGYDGFYFSNGSLEDIQGFDFETMQKPESLKNPFGLAKDGYVNNFIFTPVY